MWPTSLGFAAAAAASADVIARATILAPDLLTVLATDVPIDEKSAQVRVDGSTLIRRTCSFAVPNDDGLYNPDPDGLLWWSNPWRLEYAFYVAGVPEWLPVFTGYPDEPELDDGGNGARLTVPFRDRLKLAAESFLTAPFTFPGSMSLAEGFRIGCEMAGLGTDDRWYDLDGGGALFGIDHTYEAERRWLDILDQLRKDSALEFFADPMGVIVLRPVPDPATAPVVASYRTGEGRPLLSVRKRWQPQLFNRQPVDGEDSRGNPVHAEAADTNPDSPYSVQAIGDRPAPVYRSLGITTEEQAYRVALARLPLISFVAETLDLGVPLDPSHEAGDVIEVVHQASRTSDRHVLDSFVVGTDPGAAGALSVRKVRALS